MGLQTVLAKSDIAKGRYYHFGDMQMVVLPADEACTTELTGTGEGILELQFEEYEDGELVSERSHTTIPVTNQLTSNFTLTNVEDIGTIEIDTDGDGTIDTILEPDAQTPAQVVHELNTYINLLDVQRFVKKSLLWHVNIIDRLIDHHGIRLADLQIRSLEQIVNGQARFRLLSQEEATTILGHLNELKIAITRK